MALNFTSTLNDLHLGLTPVTGWTVLSASRPAQDDDNSSGRQLTGSALIERRHAGGSVFETSAVIE